MEGCWGFKSPLGHCTNGLVAQPAEHDSLKVEVQGSTPCGATESVWACRLTGRRSACTRQMRVQLPPRSTVHPWPGGGMADTRSSEGRAHRGVRVQVPPWSLA